jgi:hypothetical protein
VRGIVSSLRRRFLGTDDTVFVGGRVGHTGAWGRTDFFYEVGDEVPQTERGHSTYSVRMREGFWCNVVQGKIQDWSVKPIHFTIIDADGRPVRENTHYLREPR